MQERERNGVRLGQPVRDLDGTSLGKVVRLYDWGFLTRRRFFGREFLLRYDEVRAVREGALVVSRSDRDLFELAAGEVPHSWRIPTPPAFPTAATPAEARDVRHDLAAGRVRGADVGDSPAPPAGAAEEPRVMTDVVLRAPVEPLRHRPVAPRAGSDAQ